MRRRVVIAALVALGALGVQAQQLPQSNSAPSSGGVYQVEQWPQYPARLAPGPGQDKVVQYCNICHSTTYITSQPPLPAKNWAAEVKKMIDVYGAPIEASDADSIVAYLQAHYTPDTIARSYPPPTSAAAGSDVYTARCAVCHQADERGLPGVFPPLAGRASSLATRPAGRRYLLHVVLYGLQGHIESAGHAYQGVMPAWGGILSDDEVAGVLNFVSHGTFAAADVAAQRATPLSAEQVRQEREGAGH